MSAQPLHASARAAKLAALVISDEAIRKGRPRISSRTDAGKPDNRFGAGAGRIRAATLAVLLAALALLLPAGAQASLYWGAGGAMGAGTISHANNDGTGVNQSFISAPNNYCGVAVDGSHIYWANLGGGGVATIARANLDGTHVNESFIGYVPGQPCGVAVDGSHLYWANFSAGTIGRANLDGTAVDQSFISGGSTPCMMALDGSHLYWANNDAGTIGRANLNGTAVDQTFISGASGPCGVAVDAAHVYWANFGGTTIGRANLDGTAANQSFINSGRIRPCSVAVDGAHLYWANNNGVGTIGRANLSGTGVNTTFISGAIMPCGVAVDSVTNSYRPDGLIKRSTDTSFIGNGIYNRTAKRQTKGFGARRGQTKVFDLKLQNDGDTSDALQAKGCRSSSGFRVSYSRGPTDVTSQVTSGAFSTGTLAPGAARRLTMRIKVRSGADHGAVKSCLLAASAPGDPTRKDAVEGKVKVR